MAFNLKIFLKKKTVKKYSKYPNFEGLLNWVFLFFVNEYLALEILANQKETLVLLN